MCDKQIKFFDWTSSNYYKNCKSQYNLISVAILILDPTLPGYFINFPTSNKDCNVFGRGGKEVKWNEYYFLVVTLLKVITVFGIQLLTMRKRSNLFVYSLNKKWELPKDELIKNKTLRQIVNYASIFAVQLLVPVVCKMIVNLINQENIMKDVTYMLSSPKYIVHSILSTAYMANFYLILDKLKLLSSNPKINDEETELTLEEDPDTSQTIDLKKLVEKSEDYDNLTYEIVTQPKNGSLNIDDLTEGTVTYTPNTNYFGSDSFVWQVKITDEDNLKSTKSTYNIIITSVNDSPVFKLTDKIVTKEEQSVEIDISATDIEDDDTTLTYKILVLPKNGTLSNIKNGTVTYTPNTNYFGNDVFTCSVTDSDESSITTQVNITVTNVNDEPILKNIQEIVINEDNTGVEIDISADDTADTSDSSLLSYSIKTPPSNGTLSNITNGKVTYTPNKNWYGNDHFVYTVIDGSIRKDGNVKIKVNSVGDIPFIRTYNDTVTNGKAIIKYSDLVTDGDANASNNHKYNVKLVDKVYGTLDNTQIESFTYTQTVYNKWNTDGTVQVSQTEDGVVISSQKIQLTVTDTEPNTTVNKDISITLENPVKINRDNLTFSIQNDINETTIPIKIEGTAVNNVSVVGKTNNVSIVEFTNKNFEKDNTDTVNYYDTKISNIKETTLLTFKVTDFSNTNIVHDEVQITITVTLPNIPATLPNIPATAVSTGEHNSLVAALAHTNLHVLSGYGPYTVFAPTDSAFDIMGLNLRDFNTDEEKETLANILSYHVTMGSIMSSDLSDGMAVDTLIQEPITVNFDGEDTVVLNGDATVIGANIETSNGIIHIIDKVLMPPSLAPTVTAELELKGIIDFTVPDGGSNGQAIHLQVLDDIADLSIFGLGIANNGGGTDGQEYTFPNPTEPVKAGQHILVAKNSNAMDSYMNASNLFDHVFESTEIRLNGDDAIELFYNGTVIETFGDVNEDGTGEPWEYTDSWAYKNDVSNWIFGGVNITDDTNTICEASKPYPFVDCPSLAGTGTGTGDESGTTSYPTDVSGTTSYPY